MSKGSVQQRFEQANKKHSSETEPSRQSLQRSTPVRIRSSVFIDGVKVKVRSIVSTGKFVTINAEGLPRSGHHTLRIEVADGTCWQGDFLVTDKDEHGEVLINPRFNALGPMREMKVDHRARVGEKFGSRSSHPSGEIEGETA